MDLSEWTPELLGAILGAVLSLVFGYFPKLKDWFNGRTPEARSGIMIGSLFLISAGAFAASCLNWLGFATCDQGGALKMLWIFFLSLMANQSTYTVTRRLHRKTTLRLVPRHVDSIYISE